MSQNRFLPVSDIHQINYDFYGNPKGIPILFLHGGPGVGYTQADQRFFHPDHFHVLFYDQRGCGQSKPFGSLNHNNTQTLIADIIQLLDHWGKTKVYLFGGSWGATLACLFAIKHPERVSGMILRGFFPATEECTAYYERGGTEAYFPKAWARYASQAPANAQDDVTAYYRKMLLSNDPAIREKYAHEMAYYSLSVCFRVPLPADKIEAMISEPGIVEKLTIQNHFAANGFFVPDGYIYDQAAEIAHIPTWIVQGRYDVLCPPVFAYRLHQLLDHSKLYLVDAGHVASEPNIEHKLKEVLEELI